MLVDDAPKGFEVATRRILVFGFVHTGRKREEQRQQIEQKACKRDFHGAILMSLNRLTTPITKPWV